MEFDRQIASKNGCGAGQQIKHVRLAELDIGDALAARFRSEKLARGICSRLKRF